MEDIQQACISLVKALEIHGQPPSEIVVEMLESAFVLRPGKRKRGHPGKPRERDAAIDHEAVEIYFGWTDTPGRPLSVRGLARSVGVTRATVRKWRKDENYRREIEEAINIAFDDGIED